MESEVAQRPLRLLARNGAKLCPHEWMVLPLTYTESLQANLYFFGTECSASKSRMIHRYSAERKLTDLTLTLLTSYSNEDRFKTGA